ncbi:MAG TPA: YqaE/Pmp3 family membrane protein [Bacteroidia bacterium]|jgi:uncharacterized membrane protein YqaE (UPF0057 family)|nr:YqaE/Pmp3 family membrane protein [Bacteroidia bacterium]
MKNIKLLTLLLAIIVLSSSCSELSSLTFTKRHYRKGYFIDYSKARPTNSTPLLIAEKDNKEPVILNNISNTDTHTLVPIPALTKTSASGTSSKSITATKIKKHCEHIALNTNCKVSQEIVSAKITNIDNTTSASANTDDYRNDSGIAFVVIIICTIFIPPLGVGLKFGVDFHFWIDLLLTLLFFIPGLIYGLVVVLM